MKDIDRAVEALRTEFQGTLFTPDVGGYEDARILFNAMIDKRPAVIAQCADVPDVQSALRFARETGLEIAVRGGGHGVAGAALTEGGIVIDLRRMNTVDVDPDARTATVGGGATIGDLDGATQAYGLATTGGRASTTGVGGFTLGGGSGWIERKFGLACDRLLSVDLITADGDPVRASETENPDLFWALHGGGGNFGVATAMTFRLDPLTDFAIALLLWPAADGPEVMRLWRDVMDAAPDEAGGGLIFLTATTEMPFVPESLDGQLAVGVLVTWIGAEQGVRDLVRPLLDRKPVGELITAIPYAQLQSMLDDPPGMRNYWSAEHLASLPDPAVDVFCAQAEGMIIPSGSQHAILRLGGAVTRETADWPISFRDAPWVVHPFGVWADPADDERAREWTRDLRAALEPWSTGAVYLNFTGDEGHERVVAGYGKANYDRLAGIKSQYDPGNLFHLNHNIRPL
ncbi:oxidoreductase [Longispora fulva]|uniref:FAD/FMN-containing dehydrogenase n=1 Tax=Longispora fulva TaxID=619741 RepID=A0A8J7KLD3_9ACTN|nr:FAD-binding oxidoreductase [Longispora fulva]MBG6137841.1 FAD/FMN-containing dehydrogenase [Longispora fulva]GIG60095.1 oxidoreductase [Longispora fulva]